jgi:hypothetical protein
MEVFMPQNDFDLQLKEQSQRALAGMLSDRTSSEQDELRETLRKDARASLYFLAKGILQYEKLTPILHKDVADWVQDLTKLRKLMLLPRGHYKTTIATKAFCVWLTIQEMVAHFGVPGCDLRILLTNESATNAERFLSEIESQWDNNMVLRWLFPELLPNKRATGVKWSEKAMTLKRNRGWSEATVNTIGVGGAAQSQHYDIQIKDDLIGREAMESPDVMQKVITWFDYADSLFISPEKGLDMISGTRWAIFDVYNYIMQKDGRYDVYTREVIEDGKPIFPEEFSLQGLAFLRERNFAHYSGQYLNNPQDPDKIDFKPQWLYSAKFEEDRAGNIYLHAGAEKCLFANLDRVMVFDPSWDEKPTAARRALVIMGMTPSGKPGIIETFASRKGIDEIITEAFRLYARWRPRGLWIETVGNQSYVMNLFKREMEKRDMLGHPQYINIQPLRTNTKLSKESRIRDAIQKYGAADGIWHTALCDAFMEEYPFFPLTQTKDVLDAAAYGLDLLRRPYTEAEETERDESEEEMLQGMSAQTGY